MIKLSHHYSFEWESKLLEKKPDSTFNSSIYQRPWTINQPLLELFSKKQDISQFRHTVVILLLLLLKCPKQFATRFHIVGKGTAQLNIQSTCHTCSSSSMARSALVLLAKHHHRSKILTLVNGVFVLLPHLTDCWKIVAFCAATSLRYSVHWPDHHLELHWGMHPRISNGVR